MGNSTPMIEQYLEIKEDYKDAILFFRLGDFYEMFLDDAKVGSAELGLTLTRRGKGINEVPMCGVPFHAADAYISRLIAKGYKVAICEQAEDMAVVNGLVKRIVTKVITPGTTLDENLLSQRGSNFMCSLFKKGKNTGLTFCEVSTGRMLVTAFDDDEDGVKTSEELYRFSPVEMIVNFEAKNIDAINEFAKKTGTRVEVYNDLYFNEDVTKAKFHEQFGSKADSMNSFMISASGALLTYLFQTQKVKPQHIVDVEAYSSAQFMEIDSNAQRNLELFETMRDKTKKGSLLWVLDDTKTTMGFRTLKNWLIRPLINVGQINARLNAVEELICNVPLREEMRDELMLVSDIERLIGRVVMGTANPKDLIKMKESVSHLPALKSMLSNFNAALLKEQEKNLDMLQDVFALISDSIMDEPPFTVRDGDIIKDGYSEELDKLRYARKNGSQIIAKMENDEKERTGIKNLKITFNKVFGYYIEVSKVNLDKVPENYIRKQTLVNAERFITEQLKEVESMVLGASEKIVALEYELFKSIRETIATEVTRIQSTARAIGITDVICSLSVTASKNNYTRPTVELTEGLDIKDGRHPVVEKVLKDSLFVPNDACLDGAKNRLLIITGPNMAGKSTYMRQTALIAIMAQMGSFVPASSCRIGIADKVFTRVGASDDLSAGQSTFSLEMNEVAAIVRGATKKSILILDEIGRGTSTFDGLAIAWSVLEYCSERIKARTLFATHYHELTMLEGKIDGVVNYSIAVKKRGDDIIFLRKIVRGGADQSYGIEVAKLSGVPAEIINRAKAVLKVIESGSGEIKLKGRPVRDEETEQVGFTDIGTKELISEIAALDANVLSPIEALNTLFDISKKAKELS